MSRPVKLKNWQGKDAWSPGQALFIAQFGHARSWWHQEPAIRDHFNRKAQAVLDFAFERSRQG